MLNDKSGNKTVSGSGKPIACVTYNDDWIKALQAMGEWYEHNIHTYQGGSTGKASGSRRMYDCPLVHRKVGDDCSGYVCACLWNHGVNVPLTGSGGFVNPSKDFEKIMNTHGFKKYNYGDYTLMPGDIMCKNGHVEIFWTDKKSYGWGNIHDAVGKHAGMPCWQAKLKYTIVWRKK